MGGREFIADLPQQRKLGCEVLLGGSEARVLADLEWRAHGVTPNTELDLIRAWRGERTGETTLRRLVPGTAWASG